MCSLDVECVLHTCAAYVDRHTLAHTCAPFSHAGPLLLPLCFVELSVGEKPTPGVQYPPTTIAVSFAR